MRYPFRCKEHGDFEVSAPIAEGPPSVVHCQECQGVAVRIYEVPPVEYRAQGFHTTDYNKHGNILEQANKAYEKEYGEKPPPPAKDVPKNLKEPY